MGVVLGCGLEAASGRGAGTGPLARGVGAALVAVSLGVACGARGADAGSGSWLRPPPGPGLASASASASPASSAPAAVVASRFRLVARGQETLSFTWETTRPAPSRLEVHGRDGQTWIEGPAAGAPVRRHRWTLHGLVPGTRYRVAPAAAHGAPMLTAALGPTRPGRDQLLWVCRHWSDEEVDVLSAPLLRSFTTQPTTAADFHRRRRLLERWLEQLRDAGASLPPAITAGKADLLADADYLKSLYYVNQARALARLDRALARLDAFLERRPQAPSR